MKRFPWSPRPPICLLLILALARLYRGSGKLGLLVARIHPRATAVRPPTGLARAAMLLFGYRVWPGCSWAKATLGVALLAWSATADWANFGDMWVTWWLGNLVGALVITTLSVFWYEQP